ncbi:MAG TPA: hypothetical protein VM096_04905 [Vicinamibacterales bacterium]|nr:hypothetical protein [Vicinamibacterales bacterium]
MRVAIIAGVILGVLYTLSPLTVLCLATLLALGALIARELTPRERAWFTTLVAVAVAVRLAAIAALFLLADPTKPYANFFGDEELFKSRTVWLRNVGLGVSVSPADMIYVFDDVGRSSYLYLLAYIQALVGDAPYGNNVFNATVFVGAGMLLYWLIRRVYGGIPALAGMAFLLFVPSLFSWSISVLKEPLYMFAAAIELVSAYYTVRAPRVWQRIVSAIVVLLSAIALGSLRVGGTELAVVGTLVGLPAGLLATRPRFAFATIIALPIVIVLAAMQPRVQERTLLAIQDAAFQHWGHVATPGYSYKLLDPRLYADMGRRAVYTMTYPEAGRYIVRAAWNFATVPRSSQIESRSALAYLPEQALWYSILFLLPIGVVAGMRSDPVLTCLLLAHGLAASAMVALTSGNIGTLIRHRGLTFPYFTWLAAIGACSLIVWLSTRVPVSSSLSARPSGEPA